MIKSFLYKKDGTFLRDVDTSTFPDTLKDETALLWLDIADMSDTDIEVLLNQFNIHPLTLEDCIMPNVRPKIEQFDEYLFLIMHSIKLNGPEGLGVGMVELDIILGRNFMVTVHSEPLQSIDVMMDRLEKKSPVITRGADFFLYAFLDNFFEYYIPIINELDTRADALEEGVFTREPSRAFLSDIYNLKKDIMFIRKAIGPQRDIIGMLTRPQFKLIKRTNHAYFRDLNDHIIRLNDLIDTSRDILLSAAESYMSMSTNRLNEIMKTLTVIATIVMPLTLIASIYGMNFRHMPELQTRFGYFAVLGVMFLIAIGSLIFFRRKKWI